jgi:hypothetical protein
MPESYLVDKSPICQMRCDHCGFSEFVIARSIITAVIAPHCASGSDDQD